MIDKLRCSKGETLVEVLLGSLIAGIALVGFFTMLMASNRMMERSDDSIKAYYEDMNAIEQQALSPNRGLITITDEEHRVIQIEVNIYQTEDNPLAAYDIVP